MASALEPHFDFNAFAARASRTRTKNPALAALAGLNLVDGALRIRRGGDGIYGDVEKPITKPAEAVAAWLKDIENSIDDRPFTRSAELREAVVAAGEEVDAAAKAMPASERLRSALYSDALTVLGGDLPMSSNFWPWLVATALGGILLGVLISRKRR